MNSPVEISLQHSIKIDKSKEEAIYLQVVYQLINAIRLGVFQEGVKLPGTRRTAEILQLNRQTIVAVYTELEAQAWIEIQPNIGAFVKNPEIQIDKSNQNTTNKKRQEAGFRFSQSYITSSPFESNQGDYIWNDGQPDLRLIDTDELYRFYRAALKRKQLHSKIGDYSFHDNNYFTEKLSYFFNLTRKTNFRENSFVIARNKETLLSVLLQVLIQPKDIILVAETSHFASNMIFKQADATIQTIPLDEQGIDVDYIRTHYQPGELRAVFVQPQQHYPTTVQLAEHRKKELIDLAHSYDFVILEDGDDVEFYYNSKLPVPLISRDTNNRTIYLGSFSKTLPPTFQMDFIVAPENFAKELKKQLALVEPQGDLVTQQALGEMLEEGLIHRNQRKHLKTYNERKNHFNNLLRQTFNDELDWKIPSGGFAFWIQFKQQISLADLVKNCAEKGVFIPRICLYQTKKIRGMRLGFAHFHPKEMEEAILRLKESYDEVKKITCGYS